jgi:DNA mismatch endonuclease (patch repair protein)
MADKLSKEKRGWNMSRIKSKDTKPELLIRKAIYKLGYRYRLHKKGMPGRPDVVINRIKTTVFVNGCFWHRHGDCSEASRPKTNSEFWENKISKNVERDVKNYKILQSAGWKVIVIWECEISNEIEKNINLLKIKLSE